MQSSRTQRDNSRRTAGHNPHPDTERSYRFRTYLACDRRMVGKTRRTAAYYVCAPKKGYTSEGHPTGGSFSSAKTT